jgi:ornithine carbamoyltransferase
MNKHFLTLLDYDKSEIIALLDLADHLKAEQKKGVPHHKLSGKTLGMIFEKNSTRTRVSCEVGMYQLGGSALFLAADKLQIGRGEPIEDTARTLSRYLDGIMIRAYSHEMVEKLAEYASIPVINGLTDAFHPCQVLADLMTVREYKGKLEGLKLCFIGACFNMANSLIIGGLKVGMRVAVASPEKFRPLGRVLDYAQGKPFELTSDPKQAARDADVIFTDVWASMGQEAETAELNAAFSNYQVNAGLMALANKGCMVQHCLPAHRGEEITADVFEAHADEIFDEAENRLHAQKAVMVTLIK